VNPPYDIANEEAAMDELRDQRVRDAAPDLLDALHNSVAIMKMAQMVEQMRGQEDAKGWDKPIAYAEAAIKKATEA
jgi:hypothetical protein